jgi:NADH-quinone oxidoreductase subunit A
MPVRPKRTYIQAGFLCYTKPFVLRRDNCAATIRLPVSISVRKAMQNPLLIDYVPIVVFLVIAAGITTVMIGASFILAQQKPDSEKLSAYECGFEAFTDARSKFDVRFYLVAMLFIIFDLDLAFLFPWAISLKDTGGFGFWSMVVFIGVFIVGFVYEWNKGALEWE